MTPLDPSKDKGADLRDKVMDIFMEASAMKLTPKQYTDKILALFAQEMTKARIDELDNILLNFKETYSGTKYRRGIPHYIVKDRIVELRYDRPIRS